MKNKLKVFMVLVICLFIFPLFVAADVGAPEVTQYEVRVKNKDGVVLTGWKDEKITVPYDTKLTVIFEYDLDGKFYGSVKYNNEYYDLSLTDVEVIEKNVDPTKFDKLDNPVKLYVFEEDCYMFNGPSKIYGQVDGDAKIPVGTELEYEYSDGLWSYVEYNGTKGWIITYSYNSLYPEYEISVANKADNGKIYIVKDVKELKVDIASDEVKSVNIQGGQELKYDYYLNFPKSMIIHINDGDIEGWLYVSDGYFEDTEGGAIYSSCGKLYIGNKDGLYVYKNGRDINSKTTKIMEYGKVLDLEYEFVYDGYSWYKVKEDGNEYWLAEKIDRDNWSDNVTSSNYNAIYKLKEDATMYKEISTSSEKIKDIKSGQELTAILNYYEDSDMWIYVSVDGEYGWLKLTKYEYIKTINACTNTVVEDPESEDKEDEKKEEDNKKISMTTKEILVLAVGGAVVLALVIIVIIKIVNKKKVA